MNQPPDHFDSIVDQFEAQWRTGDPPAVVEYLSRVAANEKQSLAKLLVPIDIEYRTKRGENVSATDYKHLGQDIQPIVQDAILSHISQQADDSDATKTHEPNNREQKSRMIGNYKLLQKLGEGGMGTVWMAEQEKPVRRRVALKLIKAGHDSKEVVARFEAERQALAMMDHHNIAKVLDGGTTETGQPYFVMELVQGIPFNKYCDQHKLSINERLELFVPICNAVQHAHRKGIIHRDLKPSNILVSLYDGKPVPKVIDFGLAKALQHQSKLTDKTLFTEFGQVVGTLQYMSPEQAEMNQLDVDTRTDIYSLGVILYELLTGSTPIDADTVKNQAIFKVLESIREKEPPRPSARLSSSTNDAIGGISQQRQIDPSKLKNILRGELDWIVMKALEKDRTRRYADSFALAEDLHCYLSGHAVKARPPSIAYLLYKSFRRHRFKIIGVIAFTIVTLFGSLGLILLYRRSSIVELEVASNRKAAETATSERDAAQEESRLFLHKNRELSSQLANVLDKHSRDEIPLSVFKDYVTFGQRLIPQLKSDLEVGRSARQLSLDSLKDGVIGIPSFVGPDSVQCVKIVNPSGSEKWFFQNVNHKNAAIASAEVRRNELELLANRLSWLDEHQSLFEILWSFGPKVDFRKKDSIGFTNDPVVIQILDGDDVLASIDDQLFLVRLESTSGLSIGQNIYLGLVYVRGTAPISWEGKVHQVITLIRVPKKDLWHAFSKTQ